MKSIKSHMANLVFLICTGPSLATDYRDQSICALQSDVENSRRLFGCVGSFDSYSNI
jgi:hypothetical protein